MSQGPTGPDGNALSGAFSHLPDSELLALSRQILAELRRRGVVRTGNAPAGDYAELLVVRATGGELAPNSERSWDVRTPEGERLQVKARMVVADTAGERQLSALRSWDFEALVVVLFNDDFTVRRAAHIPVPILRQRARWSEHTHSWLIFATDGLLSSPGAEDWTGRLRGGEVVELR